MEKLFVERWNWRTGTHRYGIGEVWEEWDGPTFLGFLKATVVDGAPKAVAATRKERDIYRDR